MAKLVIDTPTESSVSIRYGGGEVREVEAGRLRLRHFEGSAPWRVLRSRRGQRHLSGSYWSATTGAFVVYESRLELARLLLADFDPRVVGIFAQPCWVRARIGGRLRRHVPDFLLVTREGSGRVVNVKPAQRLSDPKVAEALAWPGELVRSCGWSYEVWSGGDPVVVENVRFLAAYRRPWVVDQEMAGRVGELVRDGEELALVERRLAGLAGESAVRAALLSLLWSGRLTTDLDRPLSAGSVLRRSA